MLEKEINKTVSVLGQEVLLLHTQICTGLRVKVGGSWGCRDCARAEEAGQGAEEGALGHWLSSLAR